MSDYKKEIVDCVLKNPVLAEPSSGSREFPLQNRCRADFCFNIKPAGRLFIEDDDGARAVNNLIKYWIWCEQNPSEMPVHLVHIVEGSSPAQLKNSLFLAEKIKKSVERFSYHLIEIKNWQVPSGEWIPLLDAYVQKID